MKISNLKKAVLSAGKSVFSLMVVFSMLSMSAAPLAYAAKVTVDFCHAPSGDIDKAAVFLDQPENSWSGNNGGHINHNGDFLILDQADLDLCNAIVAGAACADFIDNDADGLIDANDPGCWTDPLDPNTYNPADTDETHVPNSAPTLSGVPVSATIPELSLYTFDANATDPNGGDTLTFSAPGKPSGSTIDSSTGAFTWTPSEAQGPGVYNFNVTVSDGSLTDSDPVSITVTEVNQNPVADPKNVTTDEDTAKNITLSATDADEPTQTLAYSIVVSPLNGLLSGLNPSTGEVTYTPGANFSGVDSFTYRATDSYGGTSDAVVSITVNPVNDVPVLSAINDVTIPEEVQFSFNASASDTENNTLSYTLTDVSGTGAVLTSGGVFTWTPSEAQGPGVYSFEVIVNDGNGGIATEAFTLTVSEVNLAPVLANIPNKSVLENNTLSFTISATDADLPAQTLTYAMTSGPTGATFDALTQTFSWTPGFADSGNTSATFEVSDGTLTDSQIVPIAVGNVNRAPDLAPIGNKIVTEGGTLTFTISATDADGDVLTFSASGVPGAASFDANTRQFTWTTDFDDAGIYQVTFEVTDGNTSDQETIDITVVNVNQVPVAVGQSVVTDEDTPINLVLSASDLDLDALIYAIASNPAIGGLSNFDANLGTVTYTPGVNLNGADAFTFTATDSQDVSNPATVAITITPVNDKPVISLNGTSPMAIVQGASYTEDGATCTDVEDGTLAPLISGAVDINTVGQYVLTYNCTDSAQETVSITRTVDVQAAPAACMDGIDNDRDGKIDFAGGDPGCSSPTDNDETDPPKPFCSDGIDNDQDGNVDYPADAGCDDVNDNDETDRRGGSSGSIPTIRGEVLGATTSCGIYVDKFLRKGYKANDTVAVGKLQGFLNDYMKSGLVVDSIFGGKTETALKAFQAKHKDKILTPWNITVPTGIFYLTTQTEVNNIMCPELSLPIPTGLIPFSANPNAPKI